MHVKPDGKGNKPSKEHVEYDVRWVNVQLSNRKWRETGHATAGEARSWNKDNNDGLTESSYVLSFFN